ncbi:hypothetical protein AB0953_16595 [Streptomyces sp. NPDC046866]|uniref:DUF6919 domain-containing protein n=1 Tax=Streptomyces sp. NPDC046866 TaxID=3154921 RepID=UPI0034515553
MGSVWRDARSIADLGHAMALWMEGRGPDWPGYHGPFGQEEENGARHLIPTLAAANRAGFVTTGSQPASDGYWGGARWRQRAHVDGVVHDRSPLLGRLTALERQGFQVYRGWPKEGVVITDRDGEPQTGFGGFRLGRDHAAREWHGIGRHALRELKDHGVRLNIVDMTWGRDDRLWPALANAIR